MNNIYKGTELGAYGAMLEGLEDISQSIGVIVTTQKGAIPLEPFFGVDHLKYIDKPLDAIRGQYIAEIMDSLAMWEPRAKISAVMLEQAEAELKVNITWAPKDSNIWKTSSYYMG